MISGHHVGHRTVAAAFWIVAAFWMAAGTAQRSFVAPQHQAPY